MRNFIFVLMVLFSLNAQAYQVYIGPGGKSADAVVPIDSTGTTIKTPVNGTLVDRSGTITAGGVSQQLAPANPSRKYLLVQNPSTATEVLTVNFTTAAAATGSVVLTAGSSFVMEGNFVSSEVINVWAATTGHAFIAKEF